MNKERIVFLDYMRVIACFMVVVVHCCEMFYLFNGVIDYPDASDRGWVSLIDGLCHVSVPLFVIASAYLLVPMRGSSETFFKKRFTKIFIPFIIWSLFYAVVPVWIGRLEGNEWERIARIFYSFNDDSGHLWYMYMLIGIYAVIPIISPWLRQTGKKGLEIFLGIWFLTTFGPYLRVIFGEIWGESAWNAYHALYYYSGFIGYVVLGYYIREYASWKKSRSIVIGTVSTLVGWAATSGIFYFRSGSSSEYAYVEAPFNFCSFNISLLTFGLFVLFKNINWNRGVLLSPITELSKFSYGIYLSHIFILGFCAAWIMPYFEGLPAMILVAVLTFAISYCVCKTLRYIPFVRNCV